MVHGKEQEILLPIIAAWPKTKEQYSEEVEVDTVDAKPNGECCVLVARKAKEG